MERPAPLSAALEAITDEQWILVWLQLRVWIRHNYYWFYLRTHRDLDGIVSQAIIDTMSGKRRYPPIDKKTGLERKEVELFDFLSWTVRSLISAQLAAANKLSQLDDTLQVPELADSRKSYLLKQVNVENTVSYKDLIVAMRELVKDDPTLDQMVQIWAVEPELKPREMAKVLGLTMNQMRAAQRRLRRRLARLKETLK